MIINPNKGSSLRVIGPAFVLLFIQKSSELITISPEMNEHNKLRMFWI